VCVCARACVCVCVCVKFSPVVRLQHFVSTHFDQNHLCQILPGKQTFTLLVTLSDKFDSLTYMRHCSKSHATSLSHQLFTFCNFINWATAVRFPTWNSREPWRPFLWFVCVRLKAHFNGLPLPTLHYNCHQYFMEHCIPACHSTMAYSTKHWRKHSPDKA
jgi:hypothetical protein